VLHQSLVHLAPLLHVGVCHIVSVMSFTFEQKIYRIWYDNLFNQHSFSVLLQHGQVSLKGKHRSFHSNFRMGHSPQRKQPSLPELLQHGPDPLKENLCDNCSLQARWPACGPHQGVRSFVLCGQGSSLLWTPVLRPYSGPMCLPRKSKGIGRCVRCMLTTCRVKEGLSSSDQLVGYFYSAPLLDVAYCLA